MSKKSSATAGSGVKVTVEGLRDKAKPIADVTEKWVGTKPGDLREGLNSKDLPQVKNDDLIDKELVILGYQEREKTVKGKTSQFLVCLTLVQGADDVVVTMFGGVVRRKIQKAGEEGSLPVAGHLKLCEGADFNYFDFVA